MARQKGAVKPNYFSDFAKLRSLRIKEKVEKTGIDPEEGADHALTNHEGWKYLNKYINYLIRDLDNFVSSQMEQGASYENIGMNAVAVQLCKGELNKILNKVNDASEAVEEQLKQQGSTKKGKGGKAGS